MRFDLTRYWYRRKLHWLTIILLPFSYLFAGITFLRRVCYCVGIFPKVNFDIPVVIVGNITVGGTGKTPFVIWLANFLKSQGFKPGIISRGVGGKIQVNPHWVNITDQPQIVGDEALLLARNSGCPVVIGKNKVSNVKALMMQTECNIVISDDGLQHYRLNRDIEIAMVNGLRKFGNRQLLPAGPLRESPLRLKKVDLTIVNKGMTIEEILPPLHTTPHSDEFDLTIEYKHLISIKKRELIQLKQFSQKTIHVVTGIAHPERFFAILEMSGFKMIKHVFKDHYLFKPNDFNFKDNFPIIMTEKDAVKCESFADARYWYLPITVKINTKLEEKLIELFKPFKNKDNKNEY